MTKKYNYNYKVVPISNVKQTQTDWLMESRKKAIIWAFGQIDVTRARNYFRTHRDEEGDKYSFAAYMAYLLGQAVLEHPHINAYRDGRKKLVIFEDVDIVVIVERKFEGYIRPIPTVYTIRSAQTKHWKEIHKEIRAAQSQKAKGVQYEEKGKKQANRVKLLTKLPGWIRRWILARASKNPHQKKRFNGTLGITSVGMFLDEAGTGISTTPNTLTFQVGGTDWQPRFNEQGTLENREFLSASFAIDHAVIDGGDAARFISTFRKMFTIGKGIDFSEPPDASEKSNIIE
jgi:pyruvate/2-oxoglutarate dehydrogenase complex dihydrolipoamide acyltransferase (E2) component